MKLRTIRIVALVLVAVGIVGLAIWRIGYRSGTQPVSDSLFEKTLAIVEKNPHLKPDWDRALEDGTLTLNEARAILDRARENANPD
jgi:hypothetical protein